jgi:hypothetical protein
VAAGLLLALAACGVPVQDDPRAIEDEKLPPGLLVRPDAEPSTTPAVADQPGQDLIDVWFVSGERLVARPLVVGSAEVLQGAVELLGSPPESTADEPLRSAVPPGFVLSAEYEAGVVTIDLDPTFSDLPDQVLAIGQLVLTATEVPGVGYVDFTIEGEPIPVPTADGRSDSGAKTRDDYIALREGPSS